VASVYGVDIGGTGVKAALVDTKTGALLTERVRVKTPQPATPITIGKVVTELLDEAQWHGKVGIAFPAVISHGVAKSAANIDQAWIGTDVDAVLTSRTGRDITVLNDADAAGIAEVRFGAARNVTGVVLLLTFGTGIGSALFIDGILVPNTELGHLEIDGHDAEEKAAASVREREDMSYKKWAERVSRYLQHVERLFSPELIVLGGGVSKDADKWVPLLTVATEIRPAQLRNSAGIVGAAIAAEERS